MYSKGCVEMLGEEKWIMDEHGVSSRPLTLRGASDMLRPHFGTGSHLVEADPISQPLRTYCLQTCYSMFRGKQRVCTGSKNDQGCIITC